MRRCVCDPMFNIKDYDVFEKGFKKRSHFIDDVNCSHPVWSMAEKKGYCKQLRDLLN